MDTAFECSHLGIGKRTLLLTSWFNASRQVWQTSAPGYMHLSVVAEAAHVPSLSRQAGLDLLYQALKGALSQPPTKTLFA